MEGCPKVIKFLVVVFNFIFFVSIKLFAVFALNTIKLFCNEWCLYNNRQLSIVETDCQGTRLTFNSRSDFTNQTKLFIHMWREADSAICHFHKRKTWKSESFVSF